jgi:hypothetical protein
MASFGFEKRKADSILATSSSPKSKNPMVSRYF